MIWEPYQGYSEFISGSVLKLGLNSQGGPYRMWGVNPRSDTCKERNFPTVLSLKLRIFKCLNKACTEFKRYSSHFRVKMHPKGAKH